MTGAVMFAPLVVAAMTSLSLAVGPVQASVADGDFESCSLDGWSVTGDAFSVRADTTWWGGTFDQHGQCFLSGYLARQDAATGSVQSSVFAATDRLSFLVAGGYDPDRLRVELVRAADGVVLRRQSGYNSEQLARIVWNTNDLRGQNVVLRVVDQATGDWGHLNLDDVRTEAVDDGGNGLTYRALGMNQPSTGPAPVRYAADPLRPQYHYTPYQGWINDPVGLVQWRGQYQIFAQHHPASPFWGPMHWSHVVSDGARLTERPIALTPPPPAAPGDRTGEWSGSAVDNNGVLTLFYTRYTDPEAHPGAVQEKVFSATSADGVTFTPGTGNPVIAAPPPDAEAGFRDPQVFRDPVNGGWTMTVGSGHAGAGQVLRYSSADLRSWTYRGVLLRGDGSTGGMWECPTLIQVDGRWVLLVSTNGGVRYWVGNYNGSTFAPATTGLLDAGPHFYAAQAFTDASGRPLVMGWMNNSGAFDLNRLGGWSQSETVLRHLFVKPDGTLGSRPIDHLSTLRDPTPLMSFSSATVRPAAVRSLAAGDSLDIQTGFDLNASSASVVGLNLFASAAEKVSLSYDKASHQLTLDTTRSGYGQGGVSTATVMPDVNGRLRLRVLTDRSTVEVFTADGTALSTRIYPRHVQSNVVSAFAVGGNARLSATAVWAMRTAWQ
ncbi:MAG: GH32 C-terminal domain-containing protein [Kibdelosporangium sp.]